MDFKSVVYNAARDGKLKRLKDRLGSPYSFDPHTLRSGKFGFMDLEYLRHTFCNSSCTSANTMPYIVNLVCAVKCPELYLPIYVSTIKQKKGSTISSIITSTERLKEAQKTSTQSTSMLPQTGTSSRPTTTVSQTQGSSRKTQYTMSQQTLPTTHLTQQTSTASQLP